MKVSVSAPMRGIVLALAASLAFAAGAAGGATTTATDSPAVSIPDRALRLCVEKALGTAAGEPITEADMATLTELYCILFRDRDGRGHDQERNPYGAVRSLEGLQHAVNLRLLNLSSNEVSDLATVRDLPLTNLDISENAFADFSSVAAFSALTTLRINENPATDLTPLAGLTSLTTLDASHSGLADISPLANLSALRELRLWRNTISDLTPLAGLTALTELRLGTNNIADISPLGKLTSLTKLDIFSNAIVDISALAGLTALAELNVDGNVLTDINALSGLTSLWDLGLAHNNIWDISALTANSGLGDHTFIGLGSNPLGCAAISDVATLRARGASVHDGFADAAPAVPGDLAARAGNADATLTWQGDGNARVYEVRHRPEVERDYGAWTMVPGGGEATQHTVAGLGVGDHLFELRGVNNAGCGGVAKVSTSIGGVVEIPDAALRQCVENALGKPAGATIARSEMATLSGLTCANAGVADLTGLEAGTSIVKLDLVGNAIDDVWALGALSSLTYVGLRDNEVSDIAPLAWNRNLGDGDTVDLRGNPLNTQALSHHVPALRQRGATVHFDESDTVSVPDAALRHCVTSTLRVAGDAITEADMASLTSLNCRAHFLEGSRREYDPDKSPHGAVASLSGLQHAVNLSDLNIRDNIVADLSPLAGLPLTKLDIGDNAVTDLSALASLPTLTTLHMAGLSAPDLSPLAGLRLAVLLATGSSLTDISALAGIDTLRDLWLGGNNISDVTPLAGLTALTRLNLGANNVADISALAKLDALTYLGLYSNAIANISALRGMGALRELYLRNNRIADIGPLVDNTRLGDGDYIELGDNLIHCGTNNEQVMALRERGVTVYADATPLPAPRNLDATPGDNLATLAWQPPSGCTVAGWEFRHGTSASPTFGAWTAISGSATRHTVEGLANGQLHVFEVRAVGADSAGQAGRETGRESRIQVALAEAPEVPVEIPDPQLRTALVELFQQNGQRAGALRRKSASDNMVSQADMATLTDLQLDNRGIAELDGLEFALNLRTLRLRGNHVASVAPLAHLPMLSALWLGDNGLTGIGSLRHLDNKLTELALDGNRISDVAPLRRFRHLERLWLHDNAISDIAPLVANTGLGGGEVRPDGSSDYIDLRGNPLDAAALDTHAPSLRERGAAVLVDDGAHMVPVFLPAGSPFGEGFARVVNRSTQAGEVRVTAIDAMGRRFGPATLEVAGRQTVHFNSSDLEYGNAAKGISPGVGSGAGDWRLELRSSLNLDVWTYARTRSGLVASMNATVPEAYARHRVFTFNPGSNTRQMSRLRVINPADKAARVLIEGVDDGGTVAAVAVTVPTGGSRDFTAAALEAGAGDGIVDGRLGDGDGKWWLTATSYDGVHVLSLLEGAGQLTNLSPTPEAALDAPQHMPLFRTATIPERQGFLRVLNLSRTSESVELHAFDENGRAGASVSWAIGPAGTQVSWRDLAGGNAAKGLREGIGEGHWRLALRASGNVLAQSFQRTYGSLDVMHGFAPRSETGVSHVAFFNPANHPNAASRLRLMNTGATAAQVAITGVDDRGESPGSVVYTTVPGGASRQFTAAQLETGDADALSGALGDGEGKWRLLVESGGEVRVVSLLESPDGRLVNVSR